MFKKIILVCGFLLSAIIAFSQDLPAKPSTLVTDYTNTLSESDRQRLEDKLVTFDDSTSTQISVLIIRSVGQYDINEYTLKVARNWGIGQKGKNNGILLLVALGDRKVSIQNGYGLEGAIPDATAHEIIINDIQPRFRANDYYGGLNAATDDLMRLAKGEYKADKKPQARQTNGNGGNVIVLIIIVIVILIIIFRGRGGGGQIIDSRGGASPFWWFLGGALLGRESGGWGGFSGGNDGGRCGGGDSGGFGGFGGGDFGGGGASGGW